jgi:class 3 adenylate cyclase
MSDVRRWLETIGLAQYGDIFESNDLDIDLLRHVDDQILKDIGVASAGHRLRIRNAIAKLEPETTLDNHQNASGAATATPAPSVNVRQQRPSTVAGERSVAEAAGERRYLTVMFCDLVGSTGISAQLDAEDWRDLVGAYLDAATVAVTEMGGHVAKKLGDGLMALFGYPAAQENDAERAARAALSIQRSLSEINRKNAGAGQTSAQRAYWCRNRPGSGRYGR